MQFFSYGKEVEFSSNLPLKTAIQRLSERAKESNLVMVIGSTVPNSTLVGRVDGKGVYLYRIKPLIGNIFKPHFYGKFIANQDRIVLKGIFRLSLTAEIIVLEILLFIILAEVVVIPAVLSQREQYYFIGVPVGVGVLFLTFLFFAKWFSRDDVAWISNKIKEALISEQKTEQT